MIKFGASDLDGTLLDGDRRLPEGIFDLIGQLHEKGVLFAPASGRQYVNLQKLFAPVADQVVFICENGALVKYRGETLHVNPMADDMLPQALATIRSDPHAFPMFCTADCAYIESDAEPFSTYAHASYDNCEKLDRLEDVIGREQVCKIAIYDEISSEDCYQNLAHRIPNLRCILSGADWCDVSQRSADKGDAIRFIRRKFGIAKHECVAFGDHMNDYEMLLECGEAYVTENAYPPLKEKIGRTVPANTAGGVMQKLQEILRSLE